MCFVGGYLYELRRYVARENAGLGETKQGMINLYSVVHTLSEICMVVYINCRFRRQLLVTSWSPFDQIFVIFQYTLFTTVTKPTYRNKQLI